MQTMGTAIQMYKTDTGQLPSSLSDLLSDPGIAGWEGPYVDKGKTPRDAWKREFFYVSPGRHNEGSYDLWSAGPDGMDNQGGGDDIVNWEAYRDSPELDLQSESRGT
jgi:general secretion pathway protein G